MKRLDCFVGFIVMALIIAIVYSVRYTINQPDKTIDDFVAETYIPNLVKDLQTRQRGLIEEFNGQVEILKQVKRLEATDEKVEFVVLSIRVDELTKMLSMILISETGKIRAIERSAKMLLGKMEVKILYLRDALAQ